MSALKTSGIEPCNRLKTDSSVGAIAQGGQRLGLNHPWILTHEKAKGWRDCQPINLVM
ncbi:hypothetical protein J0895_10040 [Phormidium pseudopriestleyi FRX01]|uniref:Uncharacterized protein n=1 Tax=Phormidium pseudopriestleyi FRX01 TaxID=1759528 RepID=A0ABS3FQQ3_9CYAN|nr:hypothetical protein [Phormidium pseudopriestleyi]MBO0349440.1 hypothetical protein [Phormidium pseudopriestleyi FRX01]